MTHTENRDHALPGDEDLDLDIQYLVVAEVLDEMAWGIPLTLHGGFGRIGQAVRVYDPLTVWVRLPDDGLDRALVRPSTSSLCNGRPVRRSSPSPDRRGA